MKVQHITKKITIINRYNRLSFIVSETSHYINFHKFTEY